MKVDLTKQFEKDFSKITDEAIRLRVFEIVRKLTLVQSVREISHVQKLSGYPGCFRIRLGVYRIGFVLIDPKSVQLKRILHRKDMYKRFP